MTGDRFGFLVERRLAGVEGAGETEELSGILERSGGARGEYLESVENHVDLGGALGAAREGKEHIAMARITLNCTCSWTFFVSSTTQGYEVACPSCGQAVRLPGRKPGQESKRSAGEIAAEQLGRQQLIWRVVGGAAVVLVAAGIYAAVPSSTPPPEPRQREKPDFIRPLPPGNSASGSGSTSTSGAVSKVDPEAARTERIQKLTDATHERVRLVNMGFLVAEVFKLKGKPDDAALLQPEIERQRGEIKRSLEALEKDRALPNLDPMFEKDDVIVRLDKQNLAAMETVDKARFLREWVRTWHTSQTEYAVAVQRNGKEVVFGLTFPHASQELFKLQRQLEKLPAEPPPPAPPEGDQVDAGQRKQYLDRIAALPAGYNRFIAAPDLKKLEDLAKGARGNIEDVEWFRVRAFETFLPPLEADAAAIRMKLAELQDKVKENTVPDAVILSDGRRIEGKIVDEPGGKFRLKFALGSMALTDYKELLRGKGAGTEYPAKYEAAKGKVPLLQELMTWCEKSKLANERMYVAAQILTLDPNHEAARQVLKLPRPSLYAEKQ